MSTRVKLASDSESEGTLSSENSDQETPEEVALEDPMYYILGQYLENEEGENIATILTKLVTEITKLRIALEESKKGTVKE